MTALLHEHDTTTLQLEGELRAPVNAGLTQTVKGMIARGQSQVLVDLARLKEIDAAGVGELVAAFNVVRAAGGILRVAHASGRVRRVLDVAGLLDLFTLTSATALHGTGAGR